MQYSGTFLVSRLLGLFFAIQVKKTCLKYDNLHKIS